MTSLWPVIRHSNNTHDVTEVLRRQSQCSHVIGKNITRLDCTLDNGKNLIEMFGMYILCEINNLSNKKNSNRTVHHQNRLGTRTQLMTLIINQSHPPRLWSLLPAGVPTTAVIYSLHWLPEVVLPRSDFLWNYSEGQEKYLRELSITPVGYFTEL
jgi:hypothetical protein